MKYRTHQFTVFDGETEMCVELEPNDTGYSIYSRVIQNDSKIGEFDALLLNRVLTENWKYMLSSSFQCEAILKYLRQRQLHELRALSASRVLLFPNIGLQGFAPKLAKGEIASLAGAADDPRYFQISVPVQPGNSGGTLVDERGNVVGVVSAKLDAATALQASGALPENVNYAIKSSLLLSFLESVPEVATKLKEPNTKEQKFEDVVRSAEQAAVLVLVY